MAGTTAVTSLDGSTDTPSSRTDAPLTAAEVEAELQGIVRRRLAPQPEPDVPTRSHRRMRSLQQRPVLVGAFDSPEGFVFGSS
jgi:hypothetical protein